MAQNIALKLQLYGTEVAIENMEQLEMAIRTSRDELKRLTIGSQEFDKMANQIKKAESQLKNLQKQAEGKDLEAQIGDFGKLGGAIGASFAGATAALQLFGKESEDATAAITTAQNALTLALAARGAAEGAVVVKTYASIVATKIQTIATNTLNASTRAFFATLLANPLTLIITLLGAAAVALYAFGDSEEETAEKTVDLTGKMQENAAAVVVETQKMQILTQVINDQNSTQEQRLGAYAELQKLVPTLTNLTLEQAEAEGVINEYIADQIRLLELRARAKALEEVVFEDEKKRVQQQIAQLQNLNIVRGQERMELERRLKLGGGTAEFIRRELQAFDDETQVIRESLDPKKQYYKITQEISGIQQKQTEILDGQKKATEQLEKSEQQRLNTLRQLLEIRLQQISLEQAAERQIQNQLTAGGEIAESEAGIVKALKDRLNTQNALIKSLEQFLPLSMRLNEVMSPEMTDEAGNSFRKLRNDILGVYDTIITEGPLTNQSLANLFIGPDGLLKKTADFKREFKDVFDEATIKNIETYVGNARVLADFFNKNIKAAKDQKIDLENILRVYAGLVDASDDLNLGAKTREEIIRKLAQQEKDLLNIQIQSLQTNSKDYQDLLKQRETATGQTLDDINAQLKRFDDEFAKTAADGVKNITGLILQTDKFDQGINNTEASVKKLNKQLKQGTPDAINAFILANRQLFAQDLQLGFGGFNAQDLEKIDEEITSGRFDRFQVFAADINDLEYKLLKDGFDIRKMSYEQKLVLLREFIAKEVKDTEQGDKEVSDNFKKRTTNILAGLQGLQSALTSLAQQTSDYYRFQLDQLEAYNQKIQDQIVGTSEEANQKRLEADTIYQNKRKELEKKAAKTALQISLAQSISNAAEAITKAFAQGGPVLGQIASVVVAGINAAQIGIITAQLNSLNSMQRGGYIRTGQGGIVVGPSHEFGGVTFGQAGVQLEGGEAVLNRVSSMRFNDLLSSVNMAGGGKPLIMNNFDDSRLLEALAKQKMEPIRAYVVESDITSSQAVQRRLEQLSTL
jgi:hypothetical protein